MSDRPPSATPKYVSVHRLDGRSHPVNLHETTPYPIRCNKEDAISLASQIQQQLTGPDPEGMSTGPGPLSPAIRELRYWKSERAWFVGFNYSDTMNPKSRGNLMRYREIERAAGQALARASGHALPAGEVIEACTLQGFKLDPIPPEFWKALLIEPIPTTAPTTGESQTPASQAPPTDPLRATLALLKGSSKGRSLIKHLGALTDRRMTLKMVIGHFDLKGKDPSPAQMVNRAPAAKQLVRRTAEKLVARKAPLRLDYDWDRDDIRLVDQKQG
jgi:hypothetical protein